MNDETYTGYTLSELEEELQRERNKEKAFWSVRSTLAMMLAVIAAVVLLSIYVIPVLRITGSSMEPLLKEKDLVLVHREKDLEAGEIAAFYYNNSILVKRVIAVGGDTVDMDREGNVTVNGIRLEEPYLTDRAYGQCDIKFPYTVPESKIFVMGDHRSESIDSRNSVIGSISRGQIVGKVLFRIWPLS